MPISQNTIATNEVLALLDKASASNKTFMTKVTEGNLAQIRKLLREKAKDRKWLSRLTSTIDGGILYIVLREPSRVKLLEDLLEETLTYIESEDLYGRIMEILYGNG